MSAEAIIRNIYSTHEIELSLDWVSKTLHSNLAKSEQEVYNFFLNKSTITQSASKSNYMLPQAVAESHAIKIDHVLLELLRVFDISKSKLDQLETVENEIESEARQIIRNPVDDVGIDNYESLSGSTNGISREFSSNNNNNNNNNNNSSSSSNSLHKLLLQDSNGQLVYALELKPLGDFNVKTPLGSKVKTPPSLLFMKN